MLRHYAFALLLAIALVDDTQAQGRILLVRDNTAIAKLVTESLTSHLSGTGWMVTDQQVVADGEVAAHPESERLIVAIGTRAFSTAVHHSAGKLVIGALLTGSAVEELSINANDRWTAILLDQPLDRWVSLIQVAFPGVQQVGILTSPANLNTVRLLDKKMAERKLRLVVEQIDSAVDIVPAIERLKSRVGLLLAIPDPLTHNRSTVQPLLLTTYRAGIPVVAYSESYQQAGAVLALYSTVSQVAEQIVDSLNLVRDGKPLSNVQAPRYFTIGINGAVARSLGVQMPSALEIELRLRTSNQ